MSTTTTESKMTVQEADEAIASLLQESPVFESHDFKGHQYHKFESKAVCSLTSGEYFYVNVEFQKVGCKGSAHCIDHTDAPEFFWLVSFSGNEVSKGVDVAGGQCQHDLAKAKTHVGNAKALMKLWNNLHLNDLNAGCIHMNIQEGHKYTGEEEPCAETGYRYGSEWLVRLLTVEDVRQITTLCKVIDKKK